MKQINQQQSIIATILVVIIGLTLVTFWHRSDVSKNPTKNVAQTNQKVKSKAASDAFLKSINSDPGASQKIWTKVLDEDDVKKMVEDELQTNKKYTVTEIPDKDLNIVQTGGKEAVQNYAEVITNLVDAFNNDVKSDIPNAFTENPSSISSRNFLVRGNALVNKLYRMPVPKEAVAAHKNQIQIIQSVLETAGTFKVKAEGQDVNPYPATYRTYSITNDQYIKLNNEISTLEQKYGMDFPRSQFSGIENKEKYGQVTDFLVSLGVVKEANAFLLPGVPVTVVGDVPRFWELMLRDAIGAAFTSFIGLFLQKFIKQIEKNYMIANVAYYRDGLVSAKFADDYINKYIPQAKANPIDVKLIKSFVPEIGCNKGTTEAIRKQLNDKAIKYLGFDPTKLEAGDPDLFSKIATSKSTVLGSQETAELYFQALAADTSGYSKDAGNNEINGPGKKSPVNQDKPNQIVTSLDAISHQQLSALIATMNYGAPNATNFFSSAIGSLIVGVIKTLAFKGAKTINEQDACLETPQLNPIVEDEYSTTVPAYDNPDINKICENAQLAVEGACGREPVTADDRTRDPNGTGQNRDPAPRGVGTTAP